MKHTHAALAVAAVAVLSVPAFAQTTCTVSSDNLQTICTETTTILGAGPVMSSNGTLVNSGTGMVVTPGAPATIAVAPAPAVAVVPASTVAVAAPAVIAVPGTRILPGAAQVQASQTTVLGGPAAPGVTSSRTVVTRYWLNVPAGVEHRADFQRWLSLK
ncbi:MAG TPA: hypothetical protein VFM98_14230 [Ramlibacter sp.]|uniref:hypothetical protein n=1 Tax=Ramlibacter sp. TaxID=1917967 RepID=UPI002D808E9C|nr:hypothetical protein [Ramlibacter sp.]HET8746761.1 hypothetical protein [Ramlibacter sp.]